jgi:hypothetical protein
MPRRSKLTAPAFERRAADAMADVGRISFQRAAYCLNFSGIPPKSERNLPSRAKELIRRRVSLDSLFQMRYGIGRGKRQGQSSRDLRMPKLKMFIPAVVDQIPCWLDSGLTSAEIAEKIGCKLGTLRVRCSQLGISLRRRAELDVQSTQNLEGGNAQFCSADLTYPPNSPGPALPSRVQLTVTLSKTTIEQIRQHAASKGMSSAALAGTLLHTIAEDGLYEAILT